MDDPHRHPSFDLAFDVIFFSKFRSIILFFLICLILCLLWSKRLQSVCSLGEKLKFKFWFPVVSEVIGYVELALEKLGIASCSI